MRACDKTTKFSFAGICADGKLFAAPLPDDCDAREIFSKGGWQPPSIELIAQRILDVEISPLHPSAGKDTIMSILDSAREQLGLKGELSDLVKHWPHLTVLHDATTKKLEEWEAKRATLRADRQDRLEAQVKAAIDTLVRDGVESSTKNVAELIQPNNYQVHNNIKRHCRHLFDKTNTD